MTGLTFANEIISGKTDDLEKVVSLKNQDKFCRQMKTEFRVNDGDTSSCFEWGWRTFKAMRSLLFSAILYVESKRAKRSNYPDAIVCYSLYYSLFHASFALLCVHPQITIEQIKQIRHGQLKNLVESKFVQTKVLPESYLELLERTRVMRELTSYSIPLSGLEYSTASNILDISSSIRQARNNMKYSFQLSSLMNSIYWKTKEECEISNKQKCQSISKQKEKEINDKIKELIRYQSFPSTKYLSLGNKHYDRGDEEEAIKYFHLDSSDFRSGGQCPYALLEFLTIEKGIEHIVIKNNATQNAVDNLIMGKNQIW